VKRQRGDDGDGVDLGDDEGQETASRGKQRDGLAEMDTGLPLDLARFQDEDDVFELLNVLF
jgi:hypothetical protein